MHQKYSQFLCAILTICYWIALSCSSCNTPSSRRIDVSNEKIALKTIRFDQELYACDTNNLIRDVDRLGNRYPDFSAVFFNQLTGFRRSDSDEIFYNAVRHFLTYKDYKGLMDTVKQKFPNTQKTDEELEELFKYIHHYYPNQKYETVYYFVSGLNYWKAITIDSVVGVGLDMFLGKDYPYYASVQIPEYETKRCEPRFIPVFVAKTIYEKMFPIEQEGKDLLNLMLQNGRELLFTSYMLPDIPEYDIMGYTKEQWMWCEENEAMIWSFFSKKNLLYDTQWQDMIRYVTDGPNSSGMPAEAPGNIGSWIGWQIIKQYWKAHPDKTLQDILKDKLNAQALLESAKYRPRK